MRPESACSENEGRVSAAFAVGIAAFATWFVASFFYGAAEDTHPWLLPPVCITFLGSVCVTLFASVMLHGKFGVSFTGMRSSLIFCACLAFGSLGVWLGADVLGGAFFLPVVGACVCGFGFGCLLLCWGRVSVAAYPAGISWELLAAVVAAFAFTGACLLLPNAACAVVLGVVCPVACFVCLRRCQVCYADAFAEQQRRFAASHVDIADTRGRIPRMMTLSMAMMWMAFGVVLHKWMLDVPAFSLPAVAALAPIAGGLVAAVVTVARRVLGQSFSISNLFWFVVPLLVAGFAAISAGDTLVRFAAYLALFLSMIISYVQVWEHFSWLSSRADGIVDVQLFGWGWLFSLFGALLGMLASLILANFSLSYVAYLVPLVASALTIALLMVRMRVEKLGKDALASVAAEKEQELERRRQSEPKSLDERMREVGERYGLTPREVQVATLLAQGRSQPYISDALFISKSTVNTHVGHIYEKMGIRSKQRLIEMVSNSADEDAE